jgi:hypothetical protein
LAGDLAAPAVDAVPAADEEPLEWVPEVLAPLTPPRLLLDTEG